MSTCFGRTITTIVIFFAIDVIYSVHTKGEISCFVCSPKIDNTEALEEYFTFSNNSIENIPICGSNAAKNFTLQCPKGYKGCLTITYGQYKTENTLKSCNEYYISDCKIANYVEYCYCAQTLCNNATQKSILSDDEDADDGSGQDDQTPLYENDRKNTNNIIIQNNTPTKNNSLTKASATKLLLPKHINILSLLIIYKIM